ncbi:NUDIX hydrolase [Rubricoccus marinus]|uniref:Nudix hydrolase domain-containing protein n=1 Tax=Rubricoccus marinus TaxID=716817 RepID=A0A259U0K2_9BACT|nr:CoA pyrophosphatase [Rubricoccus marinus]OZC03476.1 hypothetical protein BSZ36_11075 [Rubricoccus marinus]
MILLDALLDPLRQRLAEPLPGFDAHATMAPFGRGDRPGMLSVDGKNARRAATLILLYPQDAASGAEGEATFVLTVRQPTLRAHSGQVSLPGGSLDGDETPKAAALREGWEEVGVPPEAPDVLGALSPLYIPPSGFAVWPIVASLDHRPAFVPQEAEVAALVDVPLAALLGDEAKQVTVRPAKLPGLEGQEFEVPFYALADLEVWGATAMMLAEFEVAVRDALRLA